MQLRLIYIIMSVYMYVQTLNGHSNLKNVVHQN